MFRFKTNILQKTKIKKNQTHESGSLSLTGKKLSTVYVMTLCLSLFLVGSCNESAGFFDFSNKSPDLQKLSKSELVRYGYGLQVALLQKPEHIKKMELEEIELTFSKPDLVRSAGRHKMWQYRSDNCVMDIYWKDNGASQPVSHFEIRQRRSVLDGAQAVVEPVVWECVQNIIQTNRHDIEAGFDDIYADLSL